MHEINPFAQTKNYVQPSDMDFTKMCVKVPHKLLLYYVVISESCERPPQNKSTQTTTAILQRWSRNRTINK